MDRASALVERLAGRGGPKLGVVEWLDSIASTSDRLKTLARAGAPEWTVVLADRQSSGRGREGRRWASPPGGLYLSVLLRPPPRAVGLVPLAAGVAVCEAARELGVSPELKWPNDVLVSGRKLGGILAEAASGPGGIEWVAVGIGVNVATDASALPPEIRPQVTSLVAQGAPEASVPGAAVAVLARLGVCYDALKASPGGLVATWKRCAAPWWGERVQVRAGDRTLRGRLRDVDGEGALVIELDDGETRHLVSGEVSRLRPAEGERDRCP